MGDYTTVVVAQADFCAVSESIHGYPPIRLSELSCQLMAACLYPICTVRKEWLPLLLKHDVKRRHQ